MRKNFSAALFISLALILAAGRGRAQATNAAPAGSSTNAPAATAPPSVPLANVVSAAVDDSNKLQEIQTALVGDHTVADVQRSLGGTVKEIDQRKEEADKLLASTPTLPLLRTTQEVWQMQRDTLSLPKATLAGRISQLETTDAQLSDMGKKWQATRATAKSSAAPSEILSRIDAVIAAIGQATTSVATLRGQILSTQSEVLTQDTRVAAELTLIKKAQTSAVNLLFVRDSSPIWDLAGKSTAQGAVPNSNVVNSNAFAPQVTQLREYVAEKFPTALLHLAIFIAFALILFWVRREVASRTRDDSVAQRAAEVFQVPIAMAAVLALLLSGWFYPLAPRLFHAGLGAAALIPAVIILRRLLEPSLRSILWAMVLAYFVDQLRTVLADQPLLARALFLLEMVAVIAFFLWLLRSGRLSHIGRDVTERTVRAYSYLALIILGLAVVANVLGYTLLSYAMGNPMLGSGYLAVILYAAVRVADGIILATLRIRPFSLLGMVQHHYLEIAGNISLCFRWTAFLWWIWETLEFFSVRSQIWTRGVSILTYADAQGVVHASIIGRIALFGLTVWATFLVSKFFRFVLAEEVYPNLKLGPGVPYAMSTMAHYLVLILGFLTALNAVGIDLSKYSVLAGALGVGLGFGLQNIMNNFVSGIILLFERPIKVGDVIQVDTALGTVESIGIRASVIRITNGSEIIMPNGNLISNQVTNWTFSDRRRAIDVPVVVAGKSDPQKVMAVLIEAAKANPLVLKDPAPQVLFTNFTGGTLNFELRAWTDTSESWGKIRSDLALAISAALERDNIAMA